MPKDIRKIFKDPVHGYIELHPLLVKMIDTPEFQRLKHIKQLGTKYLVFPGATHTRFAHSIGVAYLAECLLKHLQENQPELNIDARDSLCVQIAALCHDMGHGPFSHLFDGMFIPEVRPDCRWQHEDASVQMFDCMRKKNGLKEVMEYYGLKLDEDIAFIKELIKGCKTTVGQTGRPEDKSFLYEIVANKKNGIDVDKWDYLARDCHYVGIPNGFDQQRLLKSARVCKVDGENHICFRDKVAENIYGMFHTRYTLHRQVLQHKIGYIIDIKITDALIKANDNLRIANAIDNILDYTKLTDHLFDQILNHADLNEARRILEDVVNRCLPKFVGEARLNDVTLNGELQDKLPDQPDKATRCKVYQRKLKEHWNNMIEVETSLQPEHKKEFDIYVLDMGFGEVGKEPIENVHFYKKNDQDNAFKMEKYQVSSLKPTKFHEYLVRVYYNNSDGSYQSIQQEAQNFFYRWCRENQFIDSDLEEKDTPAEQSTSEKPKKIFNDPIYGQIELDSDLVKIIDTPQFQRLRHIKQLGGADRVYPGATHTRFEHSLGMAHLAGLMITFLKENQPDLCIDDKDILSVKIAALCYNLGHGPFSHLYERYCRKAQEEQGENAQDLYCAPEISKLILQDILKNVNLSGEIDPDFIKELIVGVDTEAQEWSSGCRTEDKAFLYEIVINKWNGIDVHTWDYFARDCHHLGIPNSFDHMRLLKSARVCKVNERNHICFRDKVADNVYDMFRTKYTLYSDAYKHKIVYIIEEKFTEVLSAAAKKLTKISPLTETSSRASYEEMAAKLAKLTDHIFEEIMYSTDDGMKDARMKLQDIVRRRLPKWVGEMRITKAEHENKQLFKEKWNKAVDEWNKLQPTVFLDKNDFRIDTIQLDSSNKEAENPLKNVYFYSKRNLNKAFKMKTYEVSSLLPDEFTEYVGRVYYKENSDEEEQDAKKCFTWLCHGKPVIELYSKPNFEGTKQVFTEDCPSFKCSSITEVRSCKVHNGVWEFCQDNDYKKPYCQLSQGQYGKLDDKSPHLSLKRVTSLKIQLYEEDNFEGLVFELPHESPFLKKLLGLKSIRSCKLSWDDDFEQPESQHSPVVCSSGGSPLPAHSVHCVPFKIQLYAKENFEEPMYETTVDIPSVERCGLKEVRSCKVLSGGWKLFKGNQYKESMYPLKSGREYPNPQSWGGNNSAAQSVKRV